MQFIVFVAVGAIATAVQYLTLIALIELAGIQPVGASTLGLVIGVLTNYTLTTT
jgi:putative flippase GtrA